MSSHNPDVYTHRQIVKLLGLTEASGEAEITFLDILSWLRDPGGDSYWQKKVAENYPAEAWTAQRNIPHDSQLACLLYDFFRGLKMLTLREQVVVALTVFDFSVSDIAEALNTSRDDVIRTLHGTPKRDEQGQVVRDKRGRPVMRQGAVAQLSKNMNGAKKVKKSAKAS